MSNEWKKEIVGREDWLARLPQKEKKLYAMYSSVADCIVTDQSIMTVPVDDHMVHRGDGVFESFKCIDGNIYNLADHLVRLEHSCEALGIALPAPCDGMADVIIQTIRAGGQRNALVRLLVSRGQGTMGVNPYACFHSEFYIVVYELPQSSIGRFPDGVSVAVSKIPIKPGIFARVKTCNYLPNVLMKKEAVDLGVDFTVSLDENRFLAEGATENIGIVTRGKELFMPPPDRVLAGTTAKRALEFAKQLVKERVLTNAEFRPISLGHVRSAAEVHIYGTTPNITPVTTFDGKPVFDGKPGPVAARLFEMLKQEMIPDSSRLTKVFE
ncbi:aminotransferase class IV [Pontiella sulfatireligans]|uniref:Branched-chain-amino-acid aminotransferase n=1 Tax=Pontiella sulfatireligans TaxID=2750658 RepID=A0A6C2UHM6_9BACT|nr:aminotransferase class IV [Pontiella sulfatireligans]VGO19439.1 Branched-chain-amino-acid aminotransferase [Pontiella sulfatireligans]